MSSRPAPDGPKSHRLTCIYPLYYHSCLFNCSAHETRKHVFLNHVSDFKEINVYIKRNSGIFKAGPSTDMFCVSMIHSSPQLLHNPVATLSLLTTSQNDSYRETFVLKL